METIRKTTLGSSTGLVCARIDYGSIAPSTGNILFFDGHMEGPVAFVWWRVRVVGFYEQLIGAFS